MLIEKKKMSKIVKLNEIKTGLVTKKIIQYTKSNKEEKKNDDKNEKKSLIFRKIGRNAKNYLSFNNSKKFSFVILSFLAFMRSSLLDFRLDTKYKLF